MDKKVKKNWIKALRSGEYKQTEGFLCSVNNGIESFCCLGVLCDLEGDGYWEITQNKDLFEEAVFFGYDYRYDYRTKNHNSYDEFPPNSLMKKVGLKRADAETLAKMNDHGDSFKVIADYIEDNL